MLLFFSGLILGNLIEWVAHRYLLHGLGKKPGSFFHHHWEHHRACRKDLRNYDVTYQGFWSSVFSKEGLGLLTLLLATLPLAWWSGWLFLGLATQCVLYFLIHRAIHLNPHVLNLLFPWHDDHHCGNQNANWCVTYPLWDHILGTRKKSGLLRATNPKK